MVAIACGGTGGHLFPGLAIADALQAHACDICLLVSPKDVDQDAVKAVVGMAIVTLPAVALQGRSVLPFLRGFWQSSRICRARFDQRAPRAVLAMGGFTSAPPVLVGKLYGATAFLHESNVIPGRANRWLAPLVETAFVGFVGTGRRLASRSVKLTGTPVRPQFTRTDAASNRMALGLDPERPVLLVTGGSQGASGLNDLVCRTLPLLARRHPELQYLHLTGTPDLEKVRRVYAAQPCRALTLPFLTEMELALGAATLAIGRAGASSLAELAAMRVPAILIPYPAAADNHQFFNARAFLETGAARQLDQASASPEHLAQTVADLVADPARREVMRAALVSWHFPDAASQIAERLLRAIGLAPSETHSSGPASDPSHRPADASIPPWREGNRNFEICRSSAP